MTIVSGMCLTKSTKTFVDCLQSFGSSWAFLALAPVTAQEGKIPGITSYNFSVVTKMIGLEVTLGSATTFPPVRSFPNNKDTPLTGKVGLVPTTTEPVTKSDTT